MSERRRDKRNRILRDGESQRNDGRYEFAYVDGFGKRQHIYSWKLEETDQLPAKARPCVSLREKERQIRKDQDDGIIPCGGNYTVLELVKRYLEQKTGVKPSTKARYQTCLNLLEKDPFGARRIDRIKPSDAKGWLIDLQQNQGKGISSLHNYKGILGPAFKMAVEDDLIRKNPFDFTLVDVVVDDSCKREAITREQKRQFLNFVLNDPHFAKYYEGIYALFYTGMRISEFVGLTVKDLDMERRIIKIDHQLQRVVRAERFIVPTKTNAGTRKIPMTDDVYKCFERILKNRRPPKVEPMIDGYTGFLFYDKNGMPMVAMHWEKYFQRAVEKYNSIYKVQLPKITPHVARHTFCTHLIASGMNPKYVQYLMGHAGIAITMDIYTDVDFADVQKAVRYYSQGCDAAMTREKCRVVKSNALSVFTTDFTTLEA